MDVTDNIAESGNVTTRDDTETGSKMVGELMLNLRLLTRIFGMVANFSFSNTSLKGSDQIVTDPMGGFSNYIGLYRPPGSDTTPAAKSARAQASRVSPLMYISHLYRFWSGSRRVKVFAPSSKNTTLLARIQGPTDGTPPRVGNIPDISSEYETAYASSSFEHSIETLKSNVLEVEVPYLRTKPISLVTNDQVYRTNFRSSLILQELGTSPLECRLYDAAGDDFSFGSMIGAPPLLLRGSGFPYEAMTPVASA